MKIYTIGHSTRTIEELSNTLKSFRIEIVVDVRKNPYFKHAPQFDSQNLENILINSGISYIHLPHLGGFRDVLPNSENLDFKNTSKVGFPDYMQTEQFERAIETLLKIAQNHKIVIFCAEANPDACHRSLISDFLTIKKHKIEHIMNVNKSHIHELTQSLIFTDGKLTYLRHS